MSFFLGEFTKLPPTIYTGGIMLYKYYTLQEINEMTHTSVVYLKKLIDDGRIKATKISKHILISEYDFLKFMEQMEVKTNDR